MTQSPVKSFLNQLLPFLILGVVITFVLWIFILLSYVLFWGLIIGLILWGIAWLKLYFMRKKGASTPKKKSGRIIEHDDDADFKS